MFDETDVTACIKAFARPIKFEKTIQSVIDAGIRNIEVAYDGPKDTIKQHRDIIGRFDANINFQQFPFNSGISVCRNSMVRNVNTKLVLLLDDDQYVSREICKSLSIFDALPNIGIVSFPWRLIGNNIPSYYQRIKKLLNTNISLEVANLKLENNVLDFMISRVLHLFLGDTCIFVYHFDYVPNSAFFRKEIFNDVLWDEQFIIGGEHQDFFLRLKEIGTMQNAICLNLFIDHDLGSDKNSSFPFDCFRHGKIEQKSNNELLTRKWNIKTRIEYMEMTQFFNVYKKFVKIENNLIKIDLKDFKIQK